MYCLLLVNGTLSGSNSVVREYLIAYFLRLCREAQVKLVKFMQPRVNTKHFLLRTIRRQFTGIE